MISFNLLIRRSKPSKSARRFFGFGFGAPHHDGFDDHRTTTFYQPGLFRIVQLDIFSVGEGHQHHDLWRRMACWSSSDTSTGHKPVRLAYRLNSVRFPKAPLVDGIFRLTLASLSGMAVIRDAGDDHQGV